MINIETRSRDDSIFFKNYGMNKKDMVILTLIVFLLNELSFLFRIVKADEYEHDQVCDEAEQLNDAVGWELLLAVVVVTRLIILMFVSDWSVLVVVADPVHDWASEHSSEDHGTEEDAEGEGPGTLPCQPLDSQYQNREYYWDSEWQDCEHNKVELSTVVYENEKELGCGVERKANKDRELDSKLVNYEATNSQSIY